MKNQDHLLDKQKREMASYVNANLFVKSVVQDIQPLYFVRDNITDQMFYYIKVQSEKR